MGTDAGPAGTSLDAAEVDPAEVGRAEVDQIEAARHWLRSHGVDPDGLREAPRATGLVAESGGAAEGGYGRSRRAGLAGSGKSLSRRRPARQEPDDAADPATGASRPDPDADPEEAARGIVLRKLAVQARTRVEFERALQERDVPEDAAAAVLDRMGELGLVDDVTFAHDWVESRQQRRHLSRTALRRELQGKGVDREVIDEALAGVEGVDEHRAALDLAQRRAGTMSGLAREVAYRRLGGMLARRGFSASVTTQVLAEVLAGWVED